MNKHDIKQAAKVYGMTVLSSFFNLLIYVSFVALTGIFADKDGNVSAGAVTAANVLALVFQAMLFVMLVYGPMWKYGNRELNAVKFGRRAEDKGRGLKIGLVAAVPSLISYAVRVAEKLLGFWPAYAAVYRLGHLSLYPLVVWAFGANVSATTAGVTWGGIALAGVPILVMPAVAAFAYRVGYADTLLSEKLVYKTTEESK